MSQKDLQTTDIANMHHKKSSKKKHKIIQFFFTNAFGILCSRIFGFLRDAMQAALLATSIYSDIFFIAFKFPNMFRRIVSEGAFVQSFLPFFLSAKNKGAFSVSIFWIFVLFIVLLSAMIMWCTPFVTQLLALGYDRERVELAIPLVRIHFWYLLLIFIVTYLSTLLQYKNIFWVNAYNTALLNIAMICAMIPYQFCETLTNKDLFDAVYAISYAVLLGGVCQILIHFYPLYTSQIWRLQYIGYRRIRQWKKHVAIRINFMVIPFFFIHLPMPCISIHFLTFDTQDSTQYTTLQPLNQQKLCKIYRKYLHAKYAILRLLHDIKIFFKAFFPAMLGASSAQIIAIIDSSLVTLLPYSDGGISTLNFANRVFQLPLALFAIALSSALFPTIAKAITQKNDDNALKHLKNAFWFLCISLAICTLGGIMLSNEIIWLLFERKNFTRDDTIAVSLAFIGYMLGLLPFGLSRVFSLWLYSKKKQAKAAKIALIALATSTFLAAIFIFCIRYFAITNGVVWELRYCLLALIGSFGGVILLIFNIKEFGIHNFLAIIQHKRYAFLLLVLLSAEFLILKVFRHYFSIT